MYAAKAKIFQAELNLSPWGPLMRITAVDQPRIKAGDQAGAVGV
jgi:hypothetical protein